MNQHSILFHEETFYRRFKPYRLPRATHDIFGGFGLETFGSDFELVKSFDRRYIWTVLDGNSVNSMFILPGLHYVNRLFYLVTRHGHYFADFTVEVPYGFLAIDTETLQQQICKVAILVRRMRERHNRGVMSNSFQFL